MPATWPKDQPIRVARQAWQHHATLTTHGGESMGMAWEWHGNGMGMAWEWPGMALSGIASYVFLNLLFL